MLLHLFLQSLLCVSHVLHSSFPALATFVQMDVVVPVSAVASLVIKIKGFEALHEIVVWVSLESAT